MDPGITVQLGPLDRLIPSLYTRMLFFFEKNLDLTVRSRNASHLPLRAMLSLSMKLQVFPRLQIFQP